MSNYRQLDYAKILQTIYHLKLRIDERFEGSGLAGICEEFHQLAVDSRARVTWISRPNMAIRFGALLALLLMVVLMVFSVTLFEFKQEKPTVIEVVQVLEALVNEGVFIGVGIFFLITVETRIKRTRALTALHELRSMAHVVDMHQLTKDPSMVGVTSNTKNSPKRQLSAFELIRYLDYCAEMFALIGKIAATYSERLPDPEIVGAASELELLCTNLSRKVWQKVTTIERNGEPI